MKIYFEFIFIINYLLDFMILYGTKRLLKINKSIINIFLGSLIGSLTTFILFIKINTISLLLIKILLDLNKNYYFQILITIIITPIIIIILIKELAKLKEINTNKYLVDIYINRKKYHLEGFIDTGNRLTSPIKKEAIILVNLKINTNKIIYVPYKALNTKGIIPCIKPDKLIINNKEYNNYLIGLAKDKFSINGLNCILPYKLKEDLC